MSEELESIGALSTAALAATALEGSDARAAHHDHARNCANCGVPLTGPFCRMCGQPGHIHRSLLHLLEEVLHGVFHFDAKGWRTIPLLIFKPGALTRRYIEGQRKTYVSPLALFLFMVFLMFFVASLGSVKEGNGMKTGDAISLIQHNIAEQAKELSDAKTAVEKAGAALEAARKQGVDLSDLQESLDDAVKDQKDADADLQRLNTEAAKLTATATAAKQANQEKSEGRHLPTPDATAKPADAVAGVGNQAAIEEQIVKSGDANWISRLAEKLKGKSWMHSDNPTINEALKHAVDNPELAMYKLKNTTYKYSFMLVPISLPFLWLMFFWRRGVAMFDHAVFVLYSLCFMSLLFDCAMLAGMAGWDALAAIMVIFVPPVHMFAQLRGAYGLGTFSALWRTVALTVVATIVLTLFILLVLVLSMH